MVSNTKRLIAVVVTHNRIEQLRITVGRLLENNNSYLSKLVVVDNASNDGTDEWLTDQDDPRLINYRMDENLGGAGGFEAGLRFAMKQEITPDWILLTDDDGRPESDALEKFHGMNLSGWDAIVASVYNPSGQICKINRPALNPFWHFKKILSLFIGNDRNDPRTGFYMSAEDYASTFPIEIDVGTFVGFFVSRRAIERTGYPDGAMFIYGDDVLYSLRMRNSGNRIGFAPELRFEHDFKSTDSTGQRFQPLWKAYYHHRNLLMVYRYASGVMFWPMLILLLPKWLYKSRYYGADRYIFRRLIRFAIFDGLRNDLTRTHAKVRSLARDLKIE